MITIMKCYLFILSPSYSGSTILYKLLHTSPNISTLISIKNPSHVGEGCALFHKTNNYKIENYLEIRNNVDIDLPMDVVKKAYESIWDLNKEILCDKSIPTLYRAKQYQEYFSKYGKVYFISLIRNPYYSRHSIKEWYDDALYVKKNINTLQNILHISYEELTNNIDNTILKILNFLPNLERLNKNITSLDGIRDKNRNQIIQNYNIISKNIIEKTKSINNNIIELMRYFNYNYHNINILNNTNAIWGQVEQPKTSNDTITYFGDYYTVKEIDTTKYSDEVLVWHTPVFSKEEWRYGLYGIKTKPTWDYVGEEDVVTLELNKTKIIDCFGFYNELDLLNYRLNLLYNIVDYFILVESTHTFVGNKKELYFNNNKTKFNKFLDKIVHIIVEDMPLQEYKKYINTIFTNEIYQRNAILRGINQLTLKDNDIIIISDLDEIPNPELIINKDNILISEHSIPMDLYWYNLNRVIKNKWNKAKILTYKNYLKYRDCQEVRTIDLPIINSYKNGWHLSYFGDVDFIHNKLNNFAHQENEVQSINNKDEIKKRLQQGDDLSIYDRDWNFNYTSILQNNNLPLKYDIFLNKYYI